MTRANTTRWYSPVGVMVWAGAMSKRIVTFRLSQRTGGRGTRAPEERFRDFCGVRSWPKADMTVGVAHVRFQG
jgi:hypothetical protein